MNRAQRRHGAAGPPALVTRHALDAVLREAAQLHQAGQLHQAELLYREVLQRDPVNPDALRLLALLAHQLGQHRVAADYLTAAARSRPHDAQIPTDMGFVQLALGDPATAEQHFRRALDVNPRKATAHYGLGNACLAGGRHAEAIAAYGEALTQDPALVDAHTNLGNARNALGDPLGALDAYQAALQLAPADVTAHGNAAVVLQDLDRLPEALQHYQAALSEGQPSYDLLCNFGNALQRTAQYEQSAEVFRLAMQQATQRPRAYSGVAGALLALFSPDDALPAAKRAVELDGHDAAALERLARAHWMAGESEEAAQRYREAHVASPGHGHDISAATMLPVVYRHATDVAAAREQYAAALHSLEASPADLADPLQQTRAPFYLAYQGQDDAALQGQLARVYLQAAPQLGFAAPPRRRGRGRSATGGRVRVGFASAYLSDHTIGRLTQGLIEQLDRDRIEVAVIHLGGAADAVATAFDSAADTAVRLTGSLEHLQAEVAALNLDALVYPEIGMEPRAYFLAFARLAPVQCAMWGHPVTTGIPNIDYFLSSRLLEPEGAQRHYSEKLVLLDRLPAYYQPPVRPPADDIRARFGLAADHHLYACPQSLFKLHPDFDPVVADILRADPAGRLVLLEGMSAHWSELLRRRFADSMPDVADRVMFLPRMDREAFLGLLQASDVVLDPLHFGGGNSTYEALGLGIPVVTLPGAFMRGRVTAACYQQMGVTDLVAHSPEDYVAKALRLVHDHAWRAAMATRIADAGSALFEDDAAVRDIEQFLLSATSGRLTSAVGRAAWAA